MKIEEQILPVFFRAMMKGYASEGSEKETIPELPGSKTTEYTEGDFRVVDCYFVAPISKQSFGTTIVWYDDEAVWMMQYAGKYVKEAIPFLKWALMETYAKQKFVGGRGAPVTKKEDGIIFTYSNYTEAPNWRNFRGREEIMYYRGSSSKILGSHRYSGRLLV